MFSLTQRLLDIIYPPRCVSCGQASDWWCESCTVSVERPPVDPCPKCLSVDAHHAADSCSGTLPFAGAVATGFYHAPALRRAIAAVKYDGVTASSISLERYLRVVATDRNHTWPWENESVLIHPMPLADKRERERGFNQAAWLADAMRHAWDLNGDVVDLLLRTPTASAQADLEHDATLRSVNVRGIFKAIRSIDRPVILIDDVVTTGSTAAEAARALLAAGAPKVYLACLALGK